MANTKIRKKGKGNCSKCGRRIREDNLFTIKGPTKKWNKWLAHNTAARKAGTGTLMCWPCWKASETTDAEMLIHAQCDNDACCRIWDEQERCGIGGWHCIHDQTGCLYNDGHNGCLHEGNDQHPLGHKEKPLS